MYFIKIVGVLSIFVSGFYTAYDFQFLGYINSNSFRSGECWFLLDIFLFIFGILYLLERKAT